MNKEKIFQKVKSTLDNNKSQLNSQKEDKALHSLFVKIYEIINNPSDDSHKVDDNFAMSKVYRIINDEKDGICVEFNQDDSINEISNYVGGIKNGLALLFENHSIKEMNSYKNGIKNGIGVKYKY
jgi:hypothetical protein